MCVAAGHDLSSRYYDASVEFDLDVSDVDNVTNSDVIKEMATGSVAKRSLMIYSCSYSVLPNQ